MGSGIIAKIGHIRDGSRSRSGATNINGSLVYIMNKEKCDMKLTAISEGQVIREINYVMNDLKTLDGLYIGCKQISDINDSVAEMMQVKEFYGKTAEEISPRLKIHNATETIEMEDTPTLAIKRKKDSSMVVGFRMLKEGEGDVFISAGNSGALLTGATLIVGRIRGIDRPAMAGILPAYNSRLVLIDSGSNTNCKPINLLQFAQMSSIYIRNTFGVENPRIGLLNIGTEETKGNELVRESYNLLKEKSKELNINFIGNVEGRDAFTGEIDAIVTDGFTGNVFLKAVEGLGKFVKRTLTESLTKNLGTKLLAIPSLPAIKSTADNIMVLSRTCFPQFKYSSKNKAHPNVIISIHTAS